MFTIYAKSSGPDESDYSNSAYVTRQCFLLVLYIFEAKSYALPKQAIFYFGIRRKLFEENLSPNNVHV